MLVAVFLIILVVVFRTAKAPVGPKPDSKALLKKDGRAYERATAIIIAY